jgi:fermentation-respiration switch protein FrsA (DUF1100 family)
VITARAVLGRLLAWPVIFVVLLNAWLYLQQPNITFYPYLKLEQTPAQWGVAFEDVQLTTEDGIKLHGWFIPYPEATKTLLFFHGNGGNISHRGGSLAIFHRLGLNTLIIDYRGYGRSEGEPDEQGLYWDAEAAWDYLTSKRGIAEEQIIIFGRSLGGAVATDLASRVKPAALILESTFTSASDMAAHLFPLLSPVILLRYRFDSATKIERVTIPILMLHSPQDEIIPYRLGRALYELAPQPKHFIEMRGGHNGGFIASQPHYEDGLRRFIAELN